MTSEYSISEGAISEISLGTPGIPVAPLEEFLISRYADSIARYLPNDEMYSAKFISGSNLRGLLRGLGRIIRQGDDYIDELKAEFLPDQTTKFLDEWEALLGIPDTCFDNKGTTLQRRTAILVKLASLGVQTADDFVALAAMFGVSVNVYAGLDVYNEPSLAPGIDLGNPKRARYTIVVTYNLSAGEAFPYTYPIPFGTGEIAILQCLFSKIRPANCQVIFQKV